MEKVTDLEAEQRKIIRRAAVAIVFCVLVLAGSYLLLPRLMAFPTGLAQRLAFALQADLFVLIWIIIGVRMVSRGRFHSAIDNPGSAFAPPSPAIAVQVAFLQNTLEQAVAAVGAHLALATLISGPLLALIPGAVFLFAIGRFTFLRGYPHGAGARAFGVVTTVVPTIGAYGWAIGLILFRSLSGSSAT
ncbi:ribosomal protein L11 (plasmid) [Tardibacter chloracetimidivorans]|uniref:MAPEG family protein n=2 Tax=Sphingomonadaceae TaxID=41297 RepID=A0A2A4FPJ9_9SPHN|nr:MULTISPECIES: MAPEG family protein [Sphingomonadaceae]API61537.1 ribosomal protein L11 [Tardibacter chloracetimidivorans]ATE67564.1 hypothetical protein CMV14_23730 [Rhizorhabdus dicambivorans]PCE40333.1 hypothetical protein COO09_20880 [Rhizorhabdus dicambivorans]